MAVLPQIVLIQVNIVHAGRRNPLPGPGYVAIDVTDINVWLRELVDGNALRAECEQTEVGNVSGVNRGRRPVGITLP